MEEIERLLEDIKADVDNLEEKFGKIGILGDKISRDPELSKLGSSVAFQSAVRVPYALADIRMAIDKIWLEIFCVENHLNE